MTVLNGIQSLRTTSLSGRAAPTASKSFSWANPATGFAANIDQRWKYLGEKNNGGQKTHMFEQTTDGTLVVLVIEKVEGITLRDYAKRFEKSQMQTTRLADGGSFYDWNGGEAWGVKGRALGKENAHLKMNVLKYGSEFWTVASVESNELSASSVSALKQALWRTVK